MLIKAGDTIWSHEGCSVALSSVEKGHYGLLIQGHYTCTHGNEGFAAFLPYELKPSAHIQPWHNWASIAAVTLESGIKLASVALWRDDPRDTIEEYDTEWEKTPVKPEMGVKPLSEVGL